MGSISDLLGGKTAKASTPNEEKDKLEIKEQLEPENMTEEEKKRLKELREAPKNPPTKNSGAATEALKE